MTAGLQKWTDHIAMSDNKERLIFSQELTRLYGDCERCKDSRIKEEILKEINILKEAIELLLQ
ncbi:hypothetical protein NLX67_16290 [Domibacillus sp. A3M-37]|uniref:hypothetical protein n=1 Tax=Domibacillus TaxID=1433999 RepID=UPI0020B8927C|nr:hypothetical protein [Domibacillus sp. A3M-37]MCP3763929.1 hypothetical protein [Domibacillus sp. A3M-37]